MLGSLERGLKCSGGAAVVEVVGRQVGLGLCPVDPFERFADAYRHAWSLGVRGRTPRKTSSETIPARLERHETRDRWRLNALEVQFHGVRGAELSWLERRPGRGPVGGRAGILPNGPGVTAALR